MAAVETATSHMLVARTSSGEMVRMNHTLEWNDAQHRWHGLDEARRKGEFPHVQFFAVRAVDDSQWAFVRVSPEHFAPVVKAAKTLTPHQRWALLRLDRVSRFSGCTIEGSGGWAALEDTGSPSAMDHLVRKGYAVRTAVRGPRGGTHWFYRLNPAGLVERDRINSKNLKVGGR